MNVTPGIAPTLPVGTGTVTAENAVETALRAVITARGVALYWALAQVVAKTAATSRRVYAALANRMPTYTVRGRFGRA